MSTAAAAGFCQLRAREYVHVEDTATCEVLTVVGPQSFPLAKTHRLLHSSPQPCVVVPPAHYVRVRNPVTRGGEEAARGRSACAGFPLVSADAAALLNPTVASIAMGQEEVRFAQPPFPLFPGEALQGKPQPQPLLGPNEALLLERTTGDAAGRRHYFKGPGLYHPRTDERVVRAVSATLLTSTQAAYVEAEEAFVGEDGTPRVARERWTVRTPGPYFPPPHAAVVQVADAIELPPGTALRVAATADFTDHYTGEPRRAGQQWLVTRESVGAAYVPGHLERVVERDVQQVILAARQFCVVRNPHSAAAGEGGNDAVEWGAREMRVGPCNFFPGADGAAIVGPLRTAFVLTADEALLVRASRAFTDASGVPRPVAARWLVRGPCSYTPPLGAEVLERRRVIPLSQNEGVYVRNTRTGVIRSFYGEPFMLAEDEELWEKPVSQYTRRLMKAPRLCVRAEEEPDIIVDWEQSTQRDAAAMLRPHSSAGLALACSSGTADLYQQQQQQDDSAGRWEGCSDDTAAPPGNNGSGNVNGSDDDGEGGEVARDENGVRLQPRDMRRYAVVSVNVEQNALVRIRDVNTGTSRVVAGPAAVRLGPYEEFVSNTLSGGRPKHPNQIHAITLFLGPDYMSDRIEVETLDHARLQLDLAYNWEFDTTDMMQTMRRAFTMPDFIGEACKALASRVRVAIASAAFESFHRHSATVVREAIFAAAADGSTEVRPDGLYFLATGLRITNVDLQSVEPMDPTTRDALAKSVQLAVEIITRSQEKEAMHHAALIEQEAQGALDLQVVRDRTAAEEERVRLVGVVVDNAAIEQRGASRVPALAESQARLVEAQAEVDAAPLRCAAHEAGVDAELAVLQRRMAADLAHRKAMYSLQVERAAQLAEIEAAKYEAIMGALGKDTVVAIAQAGPELKAQMLSAMGLQGFLVTDGGAPVNLVNVARQLASAPAQKQ